MPLLHDAMTGRRRSSTTGGDVFVGVPEILGAGSRGCDWEVRTSQSHLALPVLPTVAKRALAAVPWLLVGRCQ